MHAQIKEWVESFTACNTRWESRTVELKFNRWEGKANGILPGSIIGAFLLYLDEEDLPNGKNAGFTIDPGDFRVDSVESCTRSAEKFHVTLTVRGVETVFKSATRDVGIPGLTIFRNEYGARLIFVHFNDQFPLWEGTTFLKVWNLMLEKGRAKRTGERQKEDATNDVAKEQLQSISDLAEEIEETLSERAKMFKEQLSAIRQRMEEMDRQGTKDD